MLIAALAVSMSTLAGCGGGGGGGSTITPVGPTPATLVGTVNASGTPAVNYTVHLSTLSAKTSSTGAFSIAFDASQITGTQTVSIYDPSGLLIDQEKFTINPAGGTEDMGAINVGPPAPPP